MHMLILAYVPNAEYYTYEEAVEIATARDEEAARLLKEDFENA